MKYPQSVITSWHEILHCNSQDIFRLYPQLCIDLLADVFHQPRGFFRIKVTYGWQYCHWVCQSLDISKLYTSLVLIRNSSVIKKEFYTSDIRQHSNYLCEYIILYRPFMHAWPLFIEMIIVTYCMHAVLLCHSCSLFDVALYVCRLICFDHCL